MNRLKASASLATAYDFMHDLADRLTNKVQLTTDGHRPYLEAVESAFGMDIDYAMLIKIYGSDQGDGGGRHGPAVGSVGSGGPSRRNGVRKSGLTRWRSPRETHRPHRARRAGHLDQRCGANSGGHHRARAGRGGAGGPRRAAVIRWDADFGYETLKEGTNSWVCSDFSGKPTRQPFDVSCWSGFSLKYLAQFRRFVAETANLEELLARMEAATADGSMVLPEYGSVNRSISQASAHVQTRLAVPGATTESLGMSDNRGQGRAWVMFAGTLAAHIMIPGY